MRKTEKIMVAVMAAIATTIPIHASSYREDTYRWSGVCQYSR